MIVSKDQALDKIANDADSAHNIADISPYFDPALNEFAGVKVDNIRKGSIAEMAGLRNGDIIKVINDQRLNSPQRTIQVLRKARNLSRLDVNLLRKERLLKFDYRIKD